MKVLGLLDTRRKREREREREGGGRRRKEEERKVEWTGQQERELTRLLKTLDLLCQ